MEEYDMFNWLLGSSKQREIIRTSVDYYGSPSYVNLYWDDVLEVLSLVEDGSEKSLRKLKEIYKFEKDRFDKLNVTLTVAPNHNDNANNSDYYPGNSWSFGVDDVHRIYENELKHRERKVELEKEKKEKEKLHQHRNSIESLQKDLKKLDYKKRT
jgi:hypothetical protein